jgi:hypothetical protein
MTDCWFDEPDGADRVSWAVPPAHGIYRGLDLELLDPGDEDVYRSLHEHRQHDPAGYARRLNELPGDWPPPEGRAEG